MTVAEAKEKKCELEQDIFELLEKFEKETGATVSDISINYFGSLSGVQLFTVKTDISL